MKYKIIVDKQSRTNPSSEKKEYVIDIEELRVKGDVYDSLIITKEEDYVMRRLSLSEYHVLSVLEEPIKETIPGLNIELFEGDNYIYLVDMAGNKFYAEYLIKNDFTDIYATKNEMNSAINQTAQSIELSVNQKLTGYSTTEEMNSAITVKSNEITSTVAKTYATKGELSTTKSEIKQTTNSISSTVSKKVGNDEIISKINQSAETVGINANKIELSAIDVLNLLAGNTINLSSKNIQISSDILNIGKDGKITIKGNKTSTDLLRVESGSDSSIFSYIQPRGAGYVYGSGGSRSVYIWAGERSSIDVTDDNGYSEMAGSGITTPSVTQTSREESKKNFEKLQNGLDIINNTEIYKYNLKSQADGDKKHIGFVIGENYKYSNEIASVDKEGKEVGVDTYSMISAAYKAIQEQQEMIEQLQEKDKQKDEIIADLITRIETLEKEVSNG